MTGDDNRDVDIAIIQTEIKTLHLNIDAGFDSVNRRLDKQNGAVAELNRFRFISIGILSALTFIVSVFGASVVALVISQF